MTNARDKDRVIFKYKHRSTTKRRNQTFLGIVELSMQAQQIDRSLSRVIKQQVFRP